MQLTNWNNIWRRGRFSVVHFYCCTFILVVSPFTRKNSGSLNQNLENSSNSLPAIVAVYSYLTFDKFSTKRAASSWQPRTDLKRSLSEYSFSESQITRKWIRLLRPLRFGTWNSGVGLHCEQSRTMERRRWREKKGKIEQLWKTIEVQ